MNKYEFCQIKKNEKKGHQDIDFYMFDVTINLTMKNADNDINNLWGVDVVGSSCFSYVLIGLNIQYDSLTEMKPNSQKDWLR